MSFTAGIENTCGVKKHMSNIFVCVPTMNDVEFISTIERIMDNSENTNKISIATTIFWKNNDIKNNKKPFFFHIKNQLDNKFKNVKYDIQPWHRYPGVGAGRLSPVKHFNNEKYFLSIDSHTDFERDWDSKIIDMYENSRKFFGKRRVLTTYLSPFKDEEPDDIVNRWPFFDFYHRLIGDLPASSLNHPLPNDKKLNEQDLNFLKQYMLDNEYLPAKKISAHFYFTESDPWLVKYNLNLDKSINFWGEEFYQSSLSYARGYNLVWYKTNIAYHKYGGGKRAYLDENLEDYDSSEIRNHIYENYIKKTVGLEQEILNKSFDDNDIVSNLFNSKSLGYLPRSIRGYLKYSDIDLINRKTSPWWEVPKLNVVYP
jgi:hypothetical protein